MIVTETVIETATGNVVELLLLNDALLVARLEEVLLLKEAVKMITRMTNTSLTEIRKKKRPNLLVTKSAAPPLKKMPLEARERIKIVSCLHNV